MRRDALVVGIDRYEGAPLTGCVSAATEIAECLALEQYAFDCVRVLNEEATRGRVLGALGSLVYEADGPGEFLVFYFAGHGAVLGEHGYLVTFDGSLYDPGLALAQIGQIMEAASTVYRHVLLILDCCHAGSALPWVSTRPLLPRDVDRAVQSAEESRCVLAACRPEQSAFEAGTRGYFTGALLDGMLGDAVDFDGQVTVFGLHDHVVSAVPASMQTPVFKGDASGAVVLGRDFEPRRGRPLKRDELARTLAKGASLLDQYHYVEQRESSDRNYRREEGARKCADELEPLLRWFHQTEGELPDLARHHEWTALRGRVRDHQGRLAAIEVGQNTRYGQVVEHLGHGGYGHVWKLSLAEGGERAFKVFHGNELDDQVKVQRFQNGHANMRKLDHPRVVRVHELTEAPYGFLMDAIPGENLRETYLDERDAEASLRLLIDIAETVQHAHSRGVRHRDIKPENVIVTFSETGRPVPYLTDFDLAYHETNRTVTTNLGVGGVINYAAPEQLYMPNAAAARAETVDVFSLAQLMYFVVTHKDPVPEDPHKNLVSLTHHLNDWVDARAAETLAGLYAQGTQRAPEERPQTVTDFLGQLARAETYALAASGRDTVQASEFCRQLGHAYKGVGNYRAGEDFVDMTSLSGQIQIRVTNKGPSAQQKDCIDLGAELSVTGDVPVANLVTGARARRAINSRLDKMIGKYPHVIRHAGNLGVFQTFISMKNVPLTLDGLLRVQEVLGTVVSGIEKWE